MKPAVVVLASWSLTLLSAASFASEVASQQTPSGAETWATWITRDVQIPLQGLPKTYTCDALWYKLHGILLAIGARKYMDIMRYNCGAKAAGGGRSPTLDLKFQTLRALSGAEARWAQTKAVQKVVRLGPGEPKTLDSGDCALLSQLNDTLFAYLQLHVLSTDLSCSAPRSAQAFGLSVEALIATPDTDPPA